jgi:hypothetical protein
MNTYYNKSNSILIDLSVLILLIYTTSLTPSDQINVFLEV